MSQYVRFHQHSVFSFRDGMLKISDMIAEAKKHNELFTLTDHGSIAGFIELYNQCRKADIKPIFGIEAYVNKNRNELFDILAKIDAEQDKDIVKELGKKRDELKQQHHLVIVAKNKLGLDNITILNNIGFCNGFYSKPLITYKEIFDLPKDKNGDRGIIVSTACLGSTFAKLVMSGNIAEAKDWASMMKSELGDNFFIEVQSNNIEEQRTLNKAAVKISQELNIPLIMGTDAHYLTEQMAETHQDLLLLQDKKTRQDLDENDFRITYLTKKGERKIKKVAPGKEFQKIPVEDLVEGQICGKDIKVEKIETTPRAFIFATDKVYYKSEADVRAEVKKFHKELIPHLDAIISSNYRISEMIESFELDTDIKLPVIENADKQLWKLIIDHCKEKKINKKRYIERIKFEYSVIIKYGFAEYFLILYDFLNYATDNNIPRGTGRGSACGSLIAYALGITRIDPIKWNLPFERFLSTNKFNPKIIIENEDGDVLEFLDEDNIEVIRDKKNIQIKAQDLIPGDIFVDRV